MCCARKAMKFKGGTINLPLNKIPGHSRINGNIPGLLALFCNKPLIVLPSSLLLSGRFLPSLFSARGKTATYGPNGRPLHTRSSSPHSPRRTYMHMHMLHMHMHMHMTCACDMHMSCTCMHMCMHMCMCMSCACAACACACACMFGAVSEGKKIVSYIDTHSDMCMLRDVCYMLHAHAHACACACTCASRFT